MSAGSRLDPEHRNVKECVVDEVLRREGVSSNLPGDSDLVLRLTLFLGDLARTFRELGEPLCLLEPCKSLCRR